MSDYDVLREKLHEIWVAPVFDHVSWHNLCCDLWDLLEHEFSHEAATTLLNEKKLH